MWLTLDDSHLTDSEHSVASSLRDVLLRTDSATLQVSAVDGPITTIAVIRRPTEVILLVIRPDRSVVIATDDILAQRWSDPVTP
jgi:hypothetical protein